MQRARAEGATVTEGSKVVDVVPQPGHIRVAFDDGRSIAASHVIAADGMWSPVRKMLHLDQPGYRGEWHAFRQYRRASGPEARKLWVGSSPTCCPGTHGRFP
ncbi:MAG: FAD-dependent monooxygenase [Acidimicrobiales bacterium]